MKKAFRYIFLAVVLCSLVLSCRRNRLIPENTLSKLYADMYLTDQWILHHSDLNSEADTMFVYSQLFEKYGYTPDDYRHTIAEYMKNPETMVKVFQNSNAILQERLKEANARDSIQLKRDSIATAIKANYSFVKMPPFYKDVLVGYYPHDTLAPGEDSRKYTLNIPVMDTSYSGPKMIVRQDVGE